MLNDKPNLPVDATRTVQMWRMGASGERTGPMADRVIREEAVTLLVADVGSFTLMCTPTDLDAMAVGFLHAEGMIDDLDDVAALSMGKAPPWSVSVRIDDPTRAAVGRNMIIASSCGFCGAASVADAIASGPVCEDTLTVAPAALEIAMKRLQERQDVFRATGGAHAAAVFGPDGEALSFAEDIGRHTALDKAIGKCLLARRPTRGCGAVLSGRVSLEMVLKAARAGIEVIAAVSAPSSMAIEAADRCHLTLCGFVRPGRANVYTCPQRISGLAGGAER